MLPNRAMKTKLEHLTQTSNLRWSWFKFESGYGSRISFYLFCDLEVCHRFLLQMGATIMGCYQVARGRGYTEILWSESWELRRSDMESPLLQHLRSRIPELLLAWGLSSVILSTMKASISIETSLTCCGICSFLNNFCDIFIVMKYHSNTNDIWWILKAYCKLQTTNINNRKKK